ncbi:THO complex subunit 7/Mft1 [Kalmanozyma brasiliensis GHG001]|uniref:Uncharacterized protein n=1 Tax=Kalmanozyma brasiliensis (strain GHG001) TaxID=1365824 RepID=V5F1J9_KALBG|nr:THO complex subunit 7/Mft1 [Kalmanozyma brasiliensis GHG001]EST10203.1 THO complex subunit 7/Mft1 [Kalmanozyma brasiliensis GHG001]
MASSSRTPLQPLTSEQQEHIIKQRMLVDERSLRRLVKKLTLLLASRDAESVSSARLSFQAELEAFRLQSVRLISIARGTSEAEIASYTSELGEIETQQQQTQERIHALKRRLEDVRRERKNKLEYDVVAGEIVKLPTRKELGESLERLREQLESVRAEKGKYADLSTNGDGRMGTVISMLDELRNDVGFEVGERERREVARADGDAEVEAVVDEEEGGKRTRKVSEDEEEEGAADSRSGSSTPRRPIRVDDETPALNPAAATFKPAAPSSTGSARRKRDSTAVTGSDEEGEVGDGAGSNSNTPRKRQRTEEGEVGSEEEEGSIQPSAVPAPSERIVRGRPGARRQR